jgi:hypothetical protein
MLALIDLEPILEKQFCFFSGGAQVGVQIVVNRSHGSAG